MTGGRGRERPEKRAPRYPWIIPAIAIAAVIVVVGAIIAVILTGARFF